MSRRKIVDAPTTRSALELLPKLSANRWFGHLPLDVRMAMLSSCQWLRLGAGELLFRQGDRLAPGTGALYCLVKGRLKVSSLREDGKEAILTVLDAGNWVGELSLIDHHERPHNGTTLSPSEFLALPRSTFEALMQTNAFSAAICNMLAARLRLVYGLVEDSTLRSTRARVARRLLLLAGIEVEGDEVAPTTLSVSQEALSMMLGITRQTLSKELGVIAASGAIRMSYRRIEITSRARLEMVGKA